MRWLHEKLQVGFIYGTGNEKLSQIILLVSAAVKWSRALMETCERSKMSLENNWF